MTTMIGTPMSAASRTTSTLRIIGALLVAGPMLVIGPRAIAGDDGGVQAFFREQFGIGGDSAPTPALAPAPEYGGGYYEERPLVVRRHRRASIVAPRRVVAEVPKGPYQPISIYEDKTLRRGDAVMTAQGVKIFVGSHSAPFNESDFVALSEADGLSKNVSQALVAINDVPRH